MLPPKTRGGGDGQRPQRAGGATAITPKNGSSAISLPQGSIITARSWSMSGCMIS
jgi:hypothetical protein